MGLKPAPGPKKTPRQSRSAATFEAIVDAGARILREGGYEALTTNRVAELAGVSVGSLYQYFPNKEAILVEMVRRHLTDLGAGIAAIASRADELTLEELVAALIEDNARAHLVDPALHKVLFEEAPRLGAMDWRDVFAEGAIATVVDLLERHRAEIVADDLPLAAEIVAASVEAIMHGAAMRGDARLASGAISRETTRLVLAYLKGAVSATRQAATADGCGLRPRDTDTIDCQRDRAGAPLAKAMSGRSARSRKTALRP